MDQREATTLPSSDSYYVHQGTSESVMDLQGAPSMHSFSNPTIHFQSNDWGGFIGSALPMDTSSTVTSHGMSVGPRPAISSMGPPPTMLQGEPMRRKRGRPRKYGRDSAFSLALSPSASTTLPIVKPTQKRRGRPLGSGRKQQLVSLGGSFFDGPGRMIPHMINVAVGEDVKGKIASFSQGQHTTVILSGIGAVSAASIGMPNFGGSVMYEGHFDILNLSGTFTRNNIGTSRGPIGCLNVMLADPDGHAIGGVVEGVMIAASHVQVFVGSLSPRTIKTKSNVGETSSADGTAGNLATTANLVSE